MWNVVVKLFEFVKIEKKLHAKGDLKTYFEVFFYQIYQRLH